MISRGSLLKLAGFLIMAITSLSVAQRSGTGGAGAPGQIGGRGPNLLENLSSNTVSLQPPPITDSDTVLLTVSVTGPQNNAVAGISRDRFQVLEDGEEQKISYFWEDSRPMTVGFIFDESDRMRERPERNEPCKCYVLKEAAQSFLKNKDPRDEYFVVRMSSFADVTVSFTTDVKRLPAHYASIGDLPLYDGVYVGLAVIKEAANPRKFLVVITAGGDMCCSLNNKKTTEDMLREIARKGNAQVYPILIVDDIADADSEFVHRDAVVMNDVALLTGGRMYNGPNSARGVEALMAEIARGLKTQYIVGFKSTREPQDGKRRGVKVKVNSPEGSPKLTAWTKSAYWTRKE